MQKTLTVGDTQLNVCIQGSGPALLLVHGFPLDHTMWRHQIEHFQNSMRVIAPDLRGFGKSPVDKRSLITMQDHADDLAELIQQLELESPVTFCGLSMGGYIGWQLLKFHGSLFDRVIMSNTRSAPDDEKTARGRQLFASQVTKYGVPPIINDMPLKLLGSNAPAGLAEELHAVISTTSPESIAAGQLGMAERPDMNWFLPNVTQPTLVICGNEDGITPSDEMKTMSADIPNSRFHEIQDSGHMTPLESPIEFNQIVTEFLANR